jgi:hypothetical protein
VELGNSPAGFSPHGDDAPTLGTMNFEGIHVRCGDMLDPETGQKIGVIMEWWFMSFPWFRFRMPLERPLQKIHTVLIEENAETPPTE